MSIQGGWVVEWRDFETVASRVDLALGLGSAALVENFFVVAHIATRGEHKIRL